MLQSELSGPQYALTYHEGWQLWEGGADPFPEPLLEISLPLQQ